MATVILVAALGAAVGIGVYSLWTAWPQRNRGRMVECCACGKELPVAKAVIVTGTVTHDREAGAVTVAEYHKKCAP